MDIIPGSLVFAPGKEGALEHVSALSLCAGEDGKLRGYHVMHYPEQTYGRAFGPLDLEQTIRFCRSLEKRLDEHRRLETCLFLTTAPNDQIAYTNAVVLLGGYLILRVGWSAKSVERLLGSAVSSRRIPCSWSKGNSQSRKDIMQVHHCWLGFEAAKKHNWVADACFSDDSAANLACSQYCHTVSTYDACWVVPEKLLVCADPVTTVIDPNPCTFTDLFGDISTCPSPSLTDLDFSRMIDGPDPGQTSPNQRIVSKNSSAVLRQTSPKQRTGFKNSSASLDATKRIKLSLHALEGACATIPEVMSKEETSSEVSGPANYSTATVCKNYALYGLQLGAATSGEVLPFSAFLKKHGVSIVVRANLSHETGMLTKSYDEARLLEYGIEHVDLPFPDYRGAVPSPGVCAMLLMSMQKHLRAEHAICVHCKGGFGRSVLLACVLAVYHYDVSGRAMLGWVRVARPGAITTPEQEKFLCSLQGRASVDMLVKGFALEQPEEAGKHSGACCVLQ